MILFIRPAINAEILGTDEKLGGFYVRLDDMMGSGVVALSGKGDTIEEFKKEKAIEMKGVSVTDKGKIKLV